MKLAGDPGSDSDCRDRAVKLLGVRAQFAEELGRRLRREGYRPEVVASCLAWASERGYLDDGSLAQAQLERASGRGASARSLGLRLRSRGAPRAAIQAAMAARPEDADLEAAVELARRRLTRTQGPDGPQRVLGFLARRGFSRSVAAEAVRLALGSDTPG
ncbi:MAG: regulatory protein RecX [Candidatus Dormibacteria bacterium]